MKKVLLTLLAVAVILGVLAGAGVAGYRYGYVQGASGNGVPFVRNNDFGWNRMPMHDFDRGVSPGFQRGFNHGGFGMMDRGGGFWFFSPLRFVIQIGILGLLIWLIYKLFTGWRFTLTRRASETPSVEPAGTETRATEDMK